MTDGTALLTRLAKQAVSRLLTAPQPAPIATALFTDAERQQLADELTAVTATGNLLARSLVADQAARTRQRRQVKVKEGVGDGCCLDVPVVLQGTDYTCGCACLRAVLDYHGTEASEGELARLLGTSPETGTRPEALVQLARGFGLQTEARKGASLEDVAWALQHNAPCICAIQKNGGGHWVVVCGIAAGQVQLMDPIDGPLVVPADDFLAAWWDTADGQRYDRFALAVGAPLRESRLHRVLEAAGPVQALAPDDALSFFRALLPTLGTDPARQLPDLRRTAFTLAVATEQELLATVQQVIAGRLASGDVGTGKAAVQAVLDAAGVGSDPRYAETVFRTNAMDSYNQGLQDQLQQEAETFPVWKYSAVTDNRARPWHAARNGNYYPTSTPFNRVRGTDAKDVMNCRCTAIPIDKWEWAELQEKGARLSYA